MIWIILIVCVVMILIGRYLANEYSWEWQETFGISMLIIGAIGIILSAIAIAGLITDVTTNAKVDEIIAMYTEENAAIEQRMDDLVNNYMEYESDTLKEFKSESSITLVTMYPELKSDELVKKQIDTYVANETKIRELKEKKIYNSVYKWWLYFGK